jgi:FkbM family methyltransferase
MMRRLQNSGALNVVVECAIDGLSFVVPLWLYHVDPRDVPAIDAVLVDSICRAAEPLRNAVFFDCGAHIGLISAKVCARSKSIARVIAIEPNSDVLPVLQRNMAALRVPATTACCAVADFVGTGRLESPPYDKQPTGLYLVEGEGPVRVTTVDSFGVFGGDVVMKIDVEGGERRVIEGARRTIQSAERCVIAVEAHPNVAARTGMDPVEYVRLLESIRPFEFTIAETGRRVDSSAPLIHPGQSEVTNVICRSL